MTPQQLIDRVSAATGMSIAELAYRLGLQERTLKRIRSGEFKLAEGTHRHLLDLERLYEKPTQKPAPRLPKNGDTPRLMEEPGEYLASFSGEAVTMILRRVTQSFTVSELATLISDIASDTELAPAHRTRVVKILSEFIPERMK